MSGQSYPKKQGEAVVSAGPQEEGQRGGRTTRGPSRCTGDQKGRYSVVLNAEDSLGGYRLRKKGWTWPFSSLFLEQIQERGRNRNQVVPGLRVSGN